MNGLVTTAIAAACAYSLWRHENGCGWFTTNRYRRRYIQGHRILYL